MPILGQRMKRFKTFIAKKIISNYFVKNYVSPITMNTINHFFSVDISLEVVNNFNKDEFKNYWRNQKCSYETIYFPHICNFLFEFVPGIICCSIKCKVPTVIMGSSILLALPFKNLNILPDLTGLREYTNPEITVNKGILKYSKER